MGMPPLRLSINVSAADLQHPSFITHLSELLDRYDITSEWLEIELTEGVAVQNTESIRNVLENLIRMGITLSIDDFGTGYSQLGWLQQLPFQKLKIDRSFISDIDIRADAFRFLQSIVAMGTECRMEILAEGVETTPQGERAKEAGCVSMQGYLLAKPMPASEFPGWLSAYRK
jgi:EAL domain-containing protein (putative c-di-GMP-specific phosphodiesterase class I)